MGCGEHGIEQGGLVYTRTALRAADFGVSASGTKTWAAKLEWGQF